MLLKKFKRIYSQRRSGPARNRLGLIRKNEGSKRIPTHNVELILQSSPLRQPKIRIYPSENCGDALVS